MKVKQASSLSLRECLSDLLARKREPQARLQIPVWPDPFCKGGGAYEAASKVIGLLKRPDRRQEVQSVTTPLDLHPLSLTILSEEVVRMMINQMQDCDSRVFGFSVEGALQCSSFRSIRWSSYLWWWNNRVWVHDSVRILFLDLGDKECSHAGPSSSTKRMGQLESLETIWTLRFLPDNIKNWVDQLGAYKII